ncbi:hypothetical protein J1614_003152 [Plenodomus biglobosus]|nr:hypothetical protein J1614_003152 [Plenodomus biglobosus]
MSHINDDGAIASLASKSNDLSFTGVGNPDDYKPDDDEIVSPEGSDDDASDDESEFVEIIRTPYDLVALDRPTQPLFTRAILCQIAEEQASIQRRLKEGSTPSTVGSITSQGLDGKPHTIWAVDKDQKHNEVFVEYMSRIEPLRAFQDEFGSKFERLQPLYKYNKGMAKDVEKWIPVPYFFTTSARMSSTEHLNKNHEMDNWAKVLTRTRTLWAKSSSRSKLCELMEKAAMKTTPIRKIVCLGLGQLNTNKTWYVSAIQHMAVFTMAKKFEQLNKAKDPEAGPVKIIFQDPCYLEKDRQLLKWLYRSPGDIEFVSDPQGLLEIDSNTMVVTAFLPIGVPLMQILADLFMVAPKEGPAMLLCDSMALDVAQREYCLGDRHAPHVAKWIADGYERSLPGVKDHVLEPELRLDTFGDGVQKDREYWLTKMDYFVRK